MENLREKISEKLKFLSSDKNKTIRKIFTFSVEDLQDSPRKCFDEIYLYLDTHKDNIEDFHFNSFIDENSFSPNIVLTIVPKEEIRKHLLINDCLEKLTNLDIRPYFILDSLQKVFQSFQYEINNKETRKSIIEIIKPLLKNRILADFDILDFTNEKAESEGKVIFRVSHDNQILDFDHFLIYMSDKNLLM